MRSRAYFILLLLLANVIFAAYLAYYTLPGFKEFLNTCSAQGYVSDHYLAACASKKYGDFEHAAFYFELEKEAVRHLKQAQVLFFGNSRMQFAFSNSEVERFFDQEFSTPFYLLGFGYAEPYSFPLELYKRFDLKPKVVVVAVDGRLFEGHVSDVVRFMKKDKGSRFHHVGKQAQQHLHKWLCGPDAVGSLGIECGKKFSLFRSRRTGMWLTDYFVEPQTLPFTITDELQPQEVDKITPLAERFVKDLGLPRDCIIFTSVPFPHWNPQNTVQLATRLGVVSIEQDLGRDWATVDNSHLTANDGRRLSRSLLPKMRPVFERCSK